MTIRQLIPAFLFALPSLLFCQTQDTAIVRQRLDSLYREATQMYFQRKIKEGISFADICVEESAKYTSIFPLKYANALDLRAAFYLNDSNTLEQAEADYLASLETRLNTLGGNHTDVAKSKNNLGVFYRNIGYFGKADTFFQQAAKIWLEAKDSAFYAQAIHNRGTANQLMGNYLKADTFYNKSKDILSRRDSIRYATSLSDIGYFYLDWGKWQLAEKAFLDSRQILSVKLGRKHPLYGNVINNLANLYARMGNFKKAREMFDEMGASAVETEGKQSDKYSIYCNNIGNLFQQQGDYDAALRYLDTARQIRSPRKGVPYATVLVNIGKARAKRNGPGDYDSALDELEEAVSIFENAPNHPGYAAAIQNLAFFCEKKGQTSRAQGLYRKALEIRGEQLAKDQPEYVQAVMALADFNLQNGSVTLADSLLLVANDGLAKHMFVTGQYATEEELLAYVRLHQPEWDFFYTYVSQKRTPEWTRTAYNNVLLLKNAALQNLFYISAMRYESNSSKKDFDDWQNYRRQIGERFNNRNKPNDDRLKEIQDTANMLEKNLLKNVYFKSVYRKVTWADVSKALQPRQAAIEFITYRHYNSTFNLGGKLMYAALVLRPYDQAPVFVPLCEGSALIGQLSKVAPGFQKNSEHYIGRLYGQPELYRLLWRPIEDILKDDTLIYYAPSGELHKLNLDAIIDDRDSSLSTRYHLVRLGSTRQIVVPDTLLYDSQNTSIASGKSVYANSVLFFTDIDYYPDSIALLKATLNCRADNSTVSPSIDYCKVSKPFDQLTRTMKADSSLFGSRSIEVNRKTGYDANEECFKQIGKEKKVPVPRILHLDTHGFFDAHDTTRSQNPFHCADITHPLLRSGIALAGANQIFLNGHPFRGMEDGILTAYEVSQCDLRGTELVVLSACETGLGDIVDNEGVYGLQRAFKIAGAQHIIISLWDVKNHEFKNEFFTEFYNNWLDRNMDIRSAFRIAQKRIRVKWDNPYYWAAFMLVE